MIECVWPGVLPDLADLPALRVRVTTPRDQAELHRMLARLGYVPELVSEGEVDVYDFIHPEGGR